MKPNMPAVPDGFKGRAGKGKDPWIDPWLYRRGSSGQARHMSTITAVLESGADGCLHLPVSPELQHKVVLIVATVEPMPVAAGIPRFGCLAGKIVLAANFDAPLPDFNEYTK